MTTSAGARTRLRLMSLLMPLLSMGCFPYVYHEQHRVRIPGVDVGATLEIARIELEEGGFDAVLPIWAMRDQVVSEDEAVAISELYFSYIDKVAADENPTTAAFGVWHFTWAIANLYRNGNASIRNKLEDAYDDARMRADSLTKFKDLAAEHVSGSKIYMGDIHGAARSYARAHIIAPGNKNYLQSLDDYKKDKFKDE